MEKQHHYNTTVTWTGNTGTGTSGYAAYERAHTIAVAGKADIAASADPAFRGDRTRHNPEELLISAVASCHMLWYLHLCAVNRIIVTAYEDNATGIMQETADGGGYFSEITLHPKVTVQEAAMKEKAESLHAEANRLCFIASSLKCPVHHQPETIAG